MKGYTYSYITSIMGNTQIANLARRRGMADDGAQVKKTQSSVQGPALSPSSVPKAMVVEATS